jgi:hypothetical protein
MAAVYRLLLKKAGLSQMSWMSYVPETKARLQGLPLVLAFHADLSALDHLELPGTTLLFIDRFALPPIGCHSRLAGSKAEKGI